MHRGTKTYLKFKRTGLVEVDGIFHRPELCTGRGFVNMMCTPLCFGCGFYAIHGILIFVPTRVTLDF